MRRMKVRIAAVILSVIMLFGGAAVSASTIYHDGEFVNNNELGAGDILEPGAVIVLVNDLTVTVVDQYSTVLDVSQFEKGTWLMSRTHELDVVSASDSSLTLMMTIDYPDSEVGDIALTPEQQREMTVTNFVERLYNTALNREYDVEGRDYWLNKLLNEGGSGSAIAAGFFGSQEFIARDLNDEEFVEVLYRVFLDRTPEEAGLENWTDALANGASRDQVINGFANSTEWTNTCARFLVNP